MANYNGDVGTYSQDYFTELKECWLNKVSGPASATDFAHFAARNKVLVRAVHIWCRSNPSATAGSLHFCRSAVTIASKTVSSMSVGATFTLTLTASNTLHTMTEIASLRVTGAGDKGKWDVLYEYQVLYPSTFIGS